MTGSAHMTADQGATIGPLGLDPQLLEILACPDTHHSPLTVELPDGAWFNLRASNTEPLLRLNVEAPDELRMTELRDQVLRMVRA